MGAFFLNLTFFTSLIHFAKKQKNNDYNEKTLKTLPKFISISISLVEDDPIEFKVRSNKCFEDVIILVCDKLKINPVSRHLFSLRIPEVQSCKLKSHTWVNLSSLIEDVSNTDFEFRIRFNVPDLNAFRSTDMKAYDYYLSQVQKDLFTNSIPELNLEQNQGEIMGLFVVNMYRAVREKSWTREKVVRNYKKFIPMNVIDIPWIFFDKKVKEALYQIDEDLDMQLVKSGYLEQFKEIAPNYLAEYFKCKYGENLSEQIYVDIRVNPFHPTHPGISFKEEKSNEWQHLCTIDDLCYLIIKEEGNIEISRKNCNPIYLEFSVLTEMFSFAILLDGYYRLGVKWTFNLCEELQTPSLQKLRLLRCHGPISREFSFRKLTEIGGNAEGCYILRESDVAYDEYYIDVCCESGSTPITYEIKKGNWGNYTINDDPTNYPSLQALIKEYKSGNQKLFLRECLPPSEFDKSNLLICQYRNRFSDLKSFESPTPVFIDPESLSLIKGNFANNNYFRCITGNPLSGSCPYTQVHRGVWIYKNARRNVVFKSLKKDYIMEYLHEFLHLSSCWAFADSNFLVKCFGAPSESPLTMVMEYLPLGPLDSYLRDSNNRQSIKEVDLLKACICLANAVYYLVSKKDGMIFKKIYNEMDMQEENGFIHGKIRCRKLLVASHNENSLVVKLADPGLSYEFSDIDMHWIPPECYDIGDQICYFPMADIWAFGTTVWEIFSYGELPPSLDATLLKEFYESGKKLPKPKNCPEDVFHLMTECWYLDPHQRKTFQAALRDMNQILYKVYNARHNHTYSVIEPEIIPTLGRMQFSARMKVISGLLSESFRE